MSKLRLFALVAGVFTCLKRPRTVKNVTAVVASGIALHVTFTVGQAVFFVLQAAFSCVRAEVENEASFYEEVTAAVTKKLDGVPGPIPRPRELVPVEGFPGVFVYPSQSPLSAPLWFRLKPGSTIEHDWEWSPEPPEVAQASDWIDVRTTTVPRGRFAGERPAVYLQVFIHKLHLLRCVGSWSVHEGPPPEVHAPPPLELPPHESLCDVDIPEPFLCPISHGLMVDPVVAPSGVTYDRECIQQWLNHRQHEPVSKQYLRARWLVPNLALREMIQQWVRQLPGSARGAAA
eukprot:jgi/Mesvir1/26248/Mv05726-RA.1